uniref:glycosyltransferase family 2 protein n=1 Tax=Prevotella sp. TaxID=59823 RepID=UPI004027A516
MKLFSIIIPVYNAEAYLEECVGSCYRQDFAEADFEILLINDGSTDDSLAVMNALALKHDNIVCVSQTNKGQGCARNRAIMMAQGKYLFFCDSDDKFIDHSLSKIIKLMEEYSLEICVSIAKECDSEGNARLGLLQPMTHYKIFDGISAILNGVYLDSVCNKCYLRSFILNNHLTFNENIAHEDSLFNAEASPLAKKMMFTDICTYQYNWNGTSTDRSRTRQKVMRGLRSDIIIAKALRRIPYGLNIEAKDKIIDNYQKRSNSIIVSLFLRLLFRDDLSKEDKWQLRQLASKEELFPFKGKCLSWKTTILSKVLNIVYLFCK